LNHFYLQTLFDKLFCLKCLIFKPIQLNTFLLSFACPKESSKPACRQAGKRAPQIAKRIQCLFIKKNYVGIKNQPKDFLCRTINSSIAIKLSVRTFCGLPSRLILKF
jgi:hypothetical protein